MTRREKLVALGLPALYAVLSLVAGVVVLSTRPGPTPSIATAKAEKQKWEIVSSGYVTQYSRGRPTVDGRTVTFRDWDTGEERIFVADGRDSVHVKLVADPKE